MATGERILRILQEAGGCATAARLRGTSRRALARLLNEGQVVRDGRGHYALANAPAWLRAARLTGGVASHLTAAEAYGWPVAKASQRICVTVPPSRHRPRASGLRIHRRPLPSGDLARGITNRLDTVLDCARTLPFHEALAVADSALREGRVTADELVAAAARLRGPGARSARAVAAAADGRAANPFESALRAICLDVPGLRVTTQFEIRAGQLSARVDLADRHLRIVIEAESVEFHATAQAFRRDCRRYTALTLDGWLVLRFTWADVFHDQDSVRAALARAVAVRTPGARASERRTA